MIEQVDAECYRHAYDFICQVLQPACRKGDNESAMLLPCRSFCRDFLTGCGSRLSGNIKQALDCNTFPEYRGEGSCLTKPGKYSVLLDMGNILKVNRVN